MRLLLAYRVMLVCLPPVLLGTPSAVLRMAASGTLQRLSAAPRVQLQLVGRAQVGGARMSPAALRAVGCSSSCNHE